MAPRITAEWLRQERGACESDMREFKRLFPDGAPVTLTTVRKLRTAGFGMNWLADKLSGPRWEAYLKTAAAYLKARAAAQEAYEKAEARALVAALRQELKAQETTDG